MAAQAKSLALTTQTEKAQHYTYLKEFRVDQCPLFLQHKCTQHKPFTCFYWHFMNQRRRRPIRKRDGTFNYSPDVYCAKYDETTGVCPEGDECPYLHRTAGDTERRYHLRYYKTGKCVYDTDSRGYCVKNGPHCAFAHGAQDMRNPVYDIHEIQLMDGSEEGANSNSGPNSLDKERNALNEDPRWQDPNYVLANYKTELCKRPPRLCRQGYACPQYHNNRDRRRSPKKHKYRSTPCPNVKQGDEWGDPANCESGDNCPYCHTRTEQQFHPEIYKSTKCNDIQQTGYCPRGPFCAFAHVDKEISAMRDITVDSMTDLAAILSNALPAATSTAAPTTTTTTTASSSNSSSNRNSISQGSASDSNNQPPTPGPGPIARPRSCSTSKSQSNDSFPTYLKAPGSEREDKEANARKLENEQQSLDLLDNSRSLFMSGLHQSGQTGQSLPLGVSPLATPFYPAVDTVESVVGNALDELGFEDINVEASIEKDLENDTNNPVTSSLTAGLRGSGILSNTAPVNIPGTREDSRRLSQLSPPVNSPLGSLSSYQLSASLSSSVNPRGENSLDKGTSPFYSHSTSFSGPKFGSLQSSGMFDFTSHQNMSPSRVTHPGSLMSSYNTMNSTSLLEMQRLRDEVAVHRVKLANWDETMAQARNACEAWKREAEEASRREKLAQQERDEALAKVNSLQKELENMAGGPYLHALARLSELDYLPFNQLKQLQQQLRSDLDRLEKVIMFHQTAPKCMVCEEQNRSVTLLPCNHFVLCSCCAPLQKECPFCHREITGMPMSL